MTEINLVQAINLALARAMQEDDRVLVLGEEGTTTRNPGIWANIASGLSE